MPSSFLLQTATAARRILIGAILAAFVWAASDGRAALWPFAIFFLAIGSIARLKQLRWQRTPLDLPLLIFLGAALIGVWAAYDQERALHKFWMMLGAYLLFYAIVVQPPQNLWTVVAIFAGLGGTVAIIFLLTNDWQTYPPEFSFTRRLVYSWASVRPSLNVRGIHPNVAGSLIAILLPFQLAWLRHVTQEQEHAKTQRSILITVTALSVLALLLSSSRGAILSLAASLILWLLWQRFNPFSSALRRRIRRFIYPLVAALVTILTVTIAFWRLLLEHFFARLPLATSIIERATLAGQTIDLIADFPVIGGGLASFPGLYSRYILGIPYFYLPNGHNILLDIFLEQGFLGAVSFILIAITTLWWLLTLTSSRKTAVDGETKLLAGATFASFVVLLLHGIVEDTVYGSIGLPFLLASPAMAIALNRTENGASVTWQRQWSRANAFVLAGCGVLLIASLLLPPARTLWLNNLASIHMARVELALFPNDQWSNDHQLIRLAPAQHMFEHSVRLNKRQNTAYYRLGLIAMSHQDYEEAINQLQIAYQNNSDHIGIRKALGYSYAWSGNVEEGIVLLSQAPFVNQELLAYETWWPSQERSDLGLIAVQLQERIQATDQ